MRGRLASGMRQFVTPSRTRQAINTPIPVTPPRYSSTNSATPGSKRNWRSVITYCFIWLRGTSSQCTKESTDRANSLWERRDNALLQARLHKVPPAASSSTMPSSPSCSRRRSASAQSRSARAWSRRATRASISTSLGPSAASACLPRK